MRAGTIGIASYSYVQRTVFSQARDVQGARHTQSNYLRYHCLLVYVVLRTDTAVAGTLLVDYQVPGIHKYLA